MNSLLPYIASLIGAICYGAATVLEQIGVKNKKSIESINPLRLLSTIKQWTYSIGLALDLIGWIFFLFAVRSLPLFLVQSFIALSIVVSALLDRYWLKHTISYGEKIAIVLVVIGVVLLSIAAKPGPATETSSLFKLVLIISPLVIAVIAALLVKLRKTWLNTTSIAALAGLSFGATTIITRVIIFTQIDKQLTEFLLVISLLINGALALILLSIALQREKVNRVNSIVLGSEVIVPSIVGLVFLGDGVRNGLWILLYVGLIMVFAGTIATYSESKTK